MERSIPHPLTFVLAVALLASVGCVRHIGSPKPGPVFPDATKSSGSGEVETWPSFRGPFATGVAEGQNLPLAWNGEAEGENGGSNIRWRTAIPGVGHGSPVVWGAKIFLTSAENLEGEGDYRFGLYGSGSASSDVDEGHRWLLLCLELASGEILWQRTVREGKPRSARHPKSTHANQSAATDGEVVAAFLGSEGLHVYDLEGRKLWSRDLGILSAGSYRGTPGATWGAASSPVLFEDLVIVQADHDGPEDFLAAFDKKTGEPRWRSARDELPSWGTPSIFQHAGGVELVTNGANAIRGYDPRTGAELWRLGGSSKITAPTPVPAGDLVIVGSGRQPEKPLFAIRGGARGDLTLPEEETRGPGVAWSQPGRGPYMPTPIVYQDIVYVLNNDGVFSAYRLTDGSELYRKRLQHGGAGFSASPVAADGHLYLAGEDGEVHVVRAGESFELLASNPLGEAILASPAMVGGSLLVRGQTHLFAIGRKGE